MSSAERHALIVGRLCKSVERVIMLVLAQGCTTTIQSHLIPLLGKFLFTLLLRLCVQVKELLTISSHNAQMYVILYFKI